MSIVMIYLYRKVSYRVMLTVFQDNPPVSKCLGIFGLSTRTTEADLRDVFDRYPGFVNVKLICDYGSGTSRGFGFLTFESVDDARYVSHTQLLMHIGRGTGP